MANQKMPLDKNKLDPILSNRDRAVLMFLWKHRIATFQALKDLFFSDLTGEQAYFQMSRLKNGQYATLEKIEGTRHFVWTLGKRGIRYLTANQLSGVRTKTFRPQSQYHDLMAAAALLGNWGVHPPKSVTIASEQEMSGLELQEMPRELRKDIEHQPDGVWIFDLPQSKFAVALEVETSGKSSDRYEQTCAFYNSHPFFRHVVWIVENWSLGKRILQISRQHGVSQDSVHLFIEQKDFEQNGWSARFLNESVGRVSMDSLLNSLAGAKSTHEIGNALAVDLPSTIHRLKKSTPSPFLHFSLTLRKFDTLRSLHGRKKL